MKNRLRESIQTTLAAKLNAESMMLFEDKLAWKRYQGEIQLAIQQYNSMDFSQANNAYLINSVHLASLWTGTIPDYALVIQMIEDDSDLRVKVLNELRDSEYFQEVWDIENPHHAFINLMILLYRTTMLHVYKELSQGNAQISSTLEEMAAILYINGKKTELFRAIKHWIENWGEEGFSEKLFIQTK